MKNLAKRNRYTSLEVAEKLKIKSHSEWVSRNIKKKKKKIEDATGQEVVIESVPNKRGKPSIIAWLTEPQVVYLISNSNNTNKTGVEEMKAEVATMFRKLGERAEVLEALPNKWSKYKNQILTNHTSDPNPASKYIPDGLTDNYFSPDVVFAEFLEILEADTSYSLKWDFDIATKYIYQVTAEEYKILQTYKFLTDFDKHFNPDGSVHEHFMYMWSQDEVLPELPEIYIDSEVPIWGVTWVTEPKVFKELWQKWLKQACYIVEIYNSPELRAEHGIASHEQQNTGYWDSPEEDCEALLELLELESQLGRIKAQASVYDAYGFQAHKDWLDWLSSNHRQAILARELHLGSDAPIYFEDRAMEYKAIPQSKRFKTHCIHYPRWEAYEDGYNWDATYEEQWRARGYDNPPPTPPLSPPRPMFEKVRLYPKELRPLFDWYLNNVWLPQYSIKWLQSIDTQGFPRLCQAVKKLPISSRLPYKFIESMQPLLVAV